MKAVFDDLFCWSVFSERRQIDFNGHLWVREDGNVLIDPVPMIESDLRQLDDLGGAKWIVVTNRDHQREAAAFRERCGAQVVAHPEDVEGIEAQVDGTVGDGEEIVPGLRAVQLRFGKSAGEIALYWPEKRTILASDLVVGAPVGRFSLLMDDVLEDPPAAALEVRKLLALDFDAIVVGDGHSVMRDARERLLECLEGRTDVYINQTDSFIAVHSGFDGGWPWAADHFRTLWQRQGEVGFRRLAHGDDRPLGEVAGEQAAQVRRLACLGVRVTLDCLEAFQALREATFQGPPNRLGGDCEAALAERGVVLYRQLSEGFWGQSVAECGLALTLCALRRIPQLHTRIAAGTPEWDWRPPGGIGAPGRRGAQYSDDSAFTNGTLAGKRVRVVGAGNIGSRYAGFASALGAEVAAWDPFAAEPAFHRAGARREHHLARLVEDAEVFAPMVPLTDSTRGLVSADHIGALPAGCLVVLVTRAEICDMEALRRRVLAGELSLAADVFDREPLPPDDPLIGRHNVVHTPHIAGRTADANRSWAEHLADQFQPRG